ncbi:hypothetical protein BDV96DRAFT_598226 [Lophiotrema nucula]|uniref:Uncharacterized protein n=1 Tax=Lophiotrema nucula TaxID=690887 RepID=A0A6A5ZCX1_9PLEO|nr:hypothetical protein BDV96DRAFT_598226 [Lophiotrema nucula]
MFPSPSRHHSHHQTPFPNPTVPSFPPKSTLAIHACPTPTPSKPLFTLFLSLPLAQRISNLLLCSRQIAKLAQGLFGQQFSEQEVARRMSSLEERYDLLRESVEEELEMAWMDAGLLGQPSPLTSTFGAGKGASTGNPSQGVKRKWSDPDPITTSNRNNKKQKKNAKGKVKEVDYEEYAVTNPNCPPDIQPIGPKTGEVPLSDEEEDRMWGWSFGRATRKNEFIAGTEEVRSPNGTTFGGL